LDVCASLIIGLTALLVVAINLVVGLVADIKVVGLVKVAAFLGL